MTNSEVVAEACDAVSLVMRSLRHSLHHLDAHPTGCTDMDDWERARRQKSLDLLSSARAILEEVHSVTS